MTRLVTAVIILSCTGAASCTEIPDTHLHVLLDPLYGSQRFLYVKEYQTVTLKCIAMNLQASRFTWRHNDVTVTNRRYDVTSVPGQLSIHNVTSEHEGTYNCLVYSGVGTLVSETVIMKLAEIIAAIGGREDLKNTVKIACDVTDLVPRGLVTWTRSDKLLNTTENIHIDLNGTLIFLYKKSVDLNVNYQCHVTNSVMNVTMSGKRWFLYGDSDRSQTRPQLVSSSHVVTGTERDDVTLECVFNGDPSPDITWRKNYGRHLTSDDKHHFPTVQRRQLLITNLTKTDEGIYSCTASNTLDDARSTMRLYVRGRPQALHPPVSRTVLTGSNVTYNCAAGRAARVHWFINGVPYKTGDEMGFLDNSSTSLTVVSTASMNDSICVQCNISGGLVYTLYSACVQYVDTLPNTTTIAMPSVESEISAATKSPPPGLTTVVVSVVCGVIVILVVIVIIIVIVRKRRERVKKRLSTVGTELPNRSSLFWETQMLVKNKIGRSPQVQCHDECQHATEG